MSLVLCEGCRLAGTRPRVLHLFCLCREGENGCKSFRSKEAVEWICLPFSSCTCLPLEILVIFTCLLCLYLQNGHCAALEAPRDAGLGGGRCVLVCFPETCCLSSGRAAEGAQWPLCSVLSFMHCFHSSKIWFWGTVCTSCCLTTCLSLVVGKHVVLLFILHCKGKTSSGQCFIVLKSSLRGRMGLQRG